MSESDRLHYEELRAARHHEVLCLVLKELVSVRVNNERVWNSSEVVTIARDVADLAYPPPKDEP